jgi:hypothetical protein
VHTIDKSNVHRRTVRALAARPITGILLLDYGVWYVVALLRAGARWALTFAAGALICFCAVVTAFPHGGAS